LGRGPNLDHGPGYFRSGGIHTRGLGPPLGASTLESFGLAVDPTNERLVEVDQLLKRSYANRGPSPTGARDGTALVRPWGPAMGARLAGAVPLSTACDDVGVVVGVEHRSVDPKELAFQ
jgi:hypothetical protein